MAEVEEDSVVALDKKELNLSEELENKSHEVLMTIAKGIFSGDIFTDAHINQHSIDLLPSIFMPLIFMDEAQMFYLKQVGMIYAHMKDALPTAINGYPCFASIGMLNLNDAKIVWETYNKINKAVNSALEG